MDPGTTCTNVPARTCPRDSDLSAAHRDTLSCSHTYASGNYGSGSCFLNFCLADSDARIYCDIVTH